MIRLVDTTTLYALENGALTWYVTNLADELPSGERDLSDSFTTTASLICVSDFML